jgi:hypothetical protein
MRKLSRLWQALEQIPGLLAVPASWREYCGPDFPILEPFLRPTDDIGASYPCPYPTGGECPRKIVDYGDGEYVAICRDPWKICKNLALSLKEVLVYTPDIAALTNTIAAPLGIRWHAPVKTAWGVWDFGVSRNRETSNYRTYLSCQFGEGAFREAVHDLLLASPPGFLICAPTVDHLTADLQQELAKRSCQFLALEDQVGLSPSGDFVALESAEAQPGFAPTPVEERKRAVMAFKQRYAHTVESICKEVRVHRSDFYKWLAGKLADHLDKSKRIEHLLRSGPAR